VLVFALGVLATWLTRVRPQAQALRELRVERESILARAEEIDEELLATQEENRHLQSDVDELEAQLEQAQGERAAAQNHLDLLKVLVDVSAAQLAVAQEEPLQARAALESTDERLASLQEVLSGDQGEQIQDLRDRLALALESIGEDDFAAQRDLEVLANSLLAIESLAFDE
jgi:chromosome segregation ATPase